MHIRETHEKYCGELMGMYTKIDRAGMGGKLVK